MEVQLRQIAHSAGCLRQGGYQGVLHSQGDILLDGQSVFTMDDDRFVVCTVAMAFKESMIALNKFV
ncbi:MAG: hypothetical protein COC22_01030 [Flavobacteriaceae bacterium]|nr:MAG: hypothetical protein COC22_01030 [Flavobacteriaceae bacterium]